MMREGFELVGVGAAIVDIVAPVREAQLAALGLTKGAMALVDRTRADKIYARIGPARESSGGSAANSVAAFAALGGRAAFVGRIAEDSFGRIFAHDMRASGVSFAARPVRKGATGRSLVLVTEDAERTMCTDLGVSAELSAQDVDETLFREAGLVFLEGYLWDSAPNRRAFAKAVRLTKMAGGRLALTLSDAGCVARHRESFLRLLGGSVDILLANEAETGALFEGMTFDEAADALGARVAVAALTRGASGALILGEGRRMSVPAVAVTEIRDVTGAGDMFAAGFLFGLVRARPLETCGAMGCLAASMVLSHTGARPEGDMRAVFASKGYL